MDAHASKFSHIDLVVSSIERSLAFYTGLLEPLGWTRLREVGGERGETIFYMSVRGPTAALGLRQKQSDAHQVPYEGEGACQPGWLSINSIR